MTELRKTILDFATKTLRAKPKTIKIIKPLVYCVAIMPKTVNGQGATFAVPPGIPNLKHYISIYDSELDIKTGDWAHLAFVVTALGSAYVAIKYRSDK
jgi:hypothetical protein